MRAWPAVVLGVVACKVPITDVDAGFLLADTSWFEEEQTLFVFYEVQAEQGIGDPSVVELRYTTDDGAIPWTAIEDLTPVHLHLPVDCGSHARCGSTSVHVPLPPRDVQLRLRYHRDGTLALDAETVFNVVGAGPDAKHRSLLVYGVFDGANERVQWRARHQFPTLRNEDAELYGLRRHFEIADQAYGTATFGTAPNPYAYGAVCPETFVDAGLPPIATEARAKFDEADLPLEAASASAVCAESTVIDALGVYRAGAVARKNPEVRPAFPLLNSPVRDATRLEFFLGPCDRAWSADHEAMLRQRLQLGGVPTTCIDDWRSPDFAGSLASTFSAAVEAARPAGQDMVLVIALAQDEAGVSAAVEDALALVVPEERDRASPRLAGAFVLDSEIHDLARPELTAVTLWCPSSGAGAAPSGESCAVQPDNPQLQLGPFTFGTLPILPSRDQYLEFIETYSKAQAGEVLDLTFRAPEFSAVASHVLFDPFGAATFLNNETLAADANDAFSWCDTDGAPLAVFRSAALQAAGPQIAAYCDYLPFPPELCATAPFGFAPLSTLPDWHPVAAERSYDVGIAWDFPFLLQMDYQVSTAVAVTAFGFSVPFGLASTGESYYGTGMWTSDAFSLAENLLQCTRFCDHPTFDSAGVYQVRDPFDPSYAHSCYVPVTPQVGDSGFPHDP